jgi:acetylcholinesterase
MGTHNVTMTSDLDVYLSTILFPRSTAEQREAILELFPLDPTQGSPFGTGGANVITPQNKRLAALIGVSAPSLPPCFIPVFPCSH